MGCGDMKTVSEVCAIAKVTRKTLFYYDRIGLLVPTSRQGKQNHKLYSEEAVEKLLLIRRYTDAGLTINEIRMIMTDPECDVAEVIRTAIKRLQKSREETEKKIRLAGILLEETSLKHD